MKKILPWPTVVTLTLFLVIWVAMQVSNDVSWSGADFILAGLLIYGSFGSYALLANRLPKHKTLVAVGIALVFVYIWAELAVGILTNWGN